MGFLLVFKNGKQVILVFFSVPFISSLLSLPLPFLNRIVTDFVCPRSRQKQITNRKTTDNIFKFARPYDDIEYSVRNFQPIYLYDDFFFSRVSFSFVRFFSSLSFRFENWENRFALGMGIFSLFRKTKNVKAGIHFHQSLEKAIIGWFTVSNLISFKRALGLLASFCISLPILYIIFG